MYARSEYYRRFCIPSEGESISNHIFNMFRFYGIQIFTAILKRVEFRKHVSEIQGHKIAFLPPIPSRKKNHIQRFENIKRDFVDLIFYAIDFFFHLI